MFPVFFVKMILCKHSVPSEGFNIITAWPHELWRIGNLSCEHVFQFPQKENFVATFTDRTKTWQGQWIEKQSVDRVHKLP